MCDGYFQGGIDAILCMLDQGGKTSRFAHPHVDIDSALEFACEAFKIECSDVWVTDDHGQKVADRVAVAKFADKTGKRITRASLVFQIVDDSAR